MSFDGTHYLNHLDDLIYYLTYTNKDSNKIQKVFTSTGSLFSRGLNYAFGDKHWYNNATARQVIHYYLWEAKVDPALNPKIHQICQILDKEANTDLEKVELELAKKACRPLDVSERICFQINADEFGAGSLLEGSSTSEALEYLTKYLAERKEKGLDTYHITDELLDEIRTAMILSFSLDSEPVQEEVKEKTEGGWRVYTRTFPPDFLEKVSEKLNRAFKQGEPLLLPGGWTGKPSGHAIYYEVIPQKNGRANFRLFNLGSGSGHHQRAIVKGKLKTAPYTEWKDIVPEKFLDPAFAQILYETNKISEHQGISTEYNADDIYQGLREYLNPEDSGEEEIELKNLMTGQRAGTCPWRSLLAMLASHIPEADFKRLTLDAQIHSLASRVDSAFLPGRNETRLRNKSHQKLSRKTHNSFKKHLISSSDFQQHAKALYKVRKSLKFRQIDIPTPSDVRYQKPQTGLTGCEAEGEILHQQIHQKLGALMPQPETKVYQQFKQLKDDFTPLSMRLDLAEKICQEALDCRGHLELELGMIEWALSLQVDPAQLKNRDEIEAAIASLGRISQSFFKNSFLVPEAEKLDPKRLYVLHKLFSTQMYLAEYMHPQWNVDAYTAPSDDFFFSYSDARMEKDLDQLKNIRNNACIEKEYKSTKCRSSDKYYLNFNYRSDPTKPIGVNTAMEFGEKKQSWSHAPIDAAYLFAEIAPETFKDLNDQDRSFSELPPYQQIARLYASENLPAWLKAIRNTHLSIKYFLQEPMGNPQNPDANFNFEFHIQDEKDKCLAWISLNGIDGKLQELYPCIKKIREDSAIRFAGMYRSFASPQNEALFRAMLKYMNYSTEKQLLCDEASIYQVNLPDEEFKELVHLACAKQSRKQEVLAFFQNHPEKLKDPDYQVFFKCFFFNNCDRSFTPSLSEEMRIHNTFSANVAAFIENVFKTYRAENELQTCAFLLQMAHQLAGYSPEQPFYSTALAELRQLLSKQALEPEERSVLYAELAAQLAAKEKLSSDEVRELLTATVYLKHNPVPSKWEDPMTSRAVRNSLIIHSATISDEISQGEGDEALLNAVLLAVFPRSNKQLWKFQSTDGKIEVVSSDGAYRYAPLSGELQAVNEGGPLPLEIREHPHFRKFFAAVHHAVPCSNNIYRIIDGKGQEMLIKLSANQLVIEQKWEGKWLRYIPAEQLFQSVDGKVHSSLSSRHLVHHFTHWRDLADPSQILVIEPESNRAACTVTLEKDQSGEIRRLKDGALLGNSSTFLGHFEDPAYVQHWFDEKGRLIEIELPRFELNFKWDEEEGRMMCEQKKGYFLDEPTRRESLGAFTHCLALKNSEGKELVLIPNQKFQPPREKEVLEPRYEIDTKVALEDRQKQTYFTYEVNAKKQLSSSSIEASLYLAEVLTLVQEYDTAAALLLKRGRGLNPFTESQKTTLEDLIALHQVTGDESGNALALRSFAGYCLVNNSMTYQKELSEKTLDLVAENYRKYLEHRSHATVLKLEETEERFLLKVLLDRHFDPLLFVRLNQLDPKYAQTLEIKSKEDKVSEPDPFGTLELKFDWNRSIIPDHKFLATRPGKQIVASLDHFLTVALKGTEQERHILQNYLPFLKVEASGKYFGLAILLETMLKHPHHFSLPPSGRDDCENERLISWKEETITLAKKLYEGSLSPHLPEKKVKIPQQEIAEAPQIKKIASGQNKTFSLALTPTPLFSQEAEKYFIQASPEEEQIESIEAMQEMATLILKEMPEDADPLEKNEWTRLAADLEKFKSQPQTPVFFPKEKDSFLQLKQAINDKKEELNSLLKAKEPLIVKQANKKPVLREDRTMQILESWGRNRKVLTLEELILYFGKNDWNGVAEANPALSDLEAAMLLSDVGDYLLEATALQQLERSEKILDDLLKLTDSESKEYKNLTQKLAAALQQSERPKKILDELLQSTNTESKEYKCLTQKLAAALQHLERPKKILDELLQLTDTESKEYKNLAQKLADALPNGQRDYDPQLNPAYLVFEYAADLLLFPQQIKMINDFLHGGDINPVMEMIMGSGKTKVLLPLLGLLRANGKDISMLIVPEPLLEDVGSSTQKILIALSQKLKTLHFDRNTTFSTLKLEIIRDELCTVQKEKQCLIMTSKSLHCLILKYIEKYEEYFNQEDNKPFPVELALMREILTLISSSGYPIIDEIDTLLNILHETSFSIGETVAPNPDEVKLISEFFTLLYNDSALKELGQMESDPSPDSKAGAFTEKVFFDKCQRLLAHKILDSLATIEFEAEGMKQKVESFMLNLKDDQRALLIDYLCRNEKTVKDAQDYYDTQLDPDIQNLIALAGEELCHLLPHTLLKNSDEKYGLDEEKGGIIALPFSAANNPSRGSQFANAFITMNYTFQIYAKKGISRSIVEGEIKRLQGEAMGEAQEGEGQIESTAAWKQFASIRGDSKITLFKYKEEEINQLVANINSSLDQKQFFIRSIILPQMLQNAEKLSCNSLLLIAMLMNKVIGFTGSLWNSKSMHRKLNPKPAAGTDAKTLALLQKHSAEPVISVKGENTEGLLKELKTKGIEFNLLADAGGYCREWTNEKVAAYLVENWGQPVLHYNKAGQQVETDREKTIPLAESKTLLNKRKTYLGQALCTGADAPQPPEAVAFVTIGENMLLRDLLQSVWRLRGLDKGQRVRFIVSDKVKAIINQELGKKAGEEITYKDILRFTIRNQARQQGKDNFKALKKELRSLPQMILLGVLLHPDVAPERQKLLYKELRSTWIQPAAQRPRELFGKIAIARDTDFVVNEEEKLCVSGLEDIFAKFPWLKEKGFNQKELLKDVASIVKRMKNSLPLKVVSPQSEDDNTVEKEQELRAEEEAQLQTVSECEKEKKKLGLISTKYLEPVQKFDDELFKCKSQPIFSLKAYLEQDEALKTYADAFDGIHLALNVLQWPEKKTSVKNLKLFGSSRTPLHFVRLYKDGGVLLLSQHEVDDSPMMPNLYHLRNGLVKKENQSLLTQEVMQRIAKVKFLKRNSHYSKQELDYLHEWIKQEGVQKMKDLYYKFSLAGSTQTGMDQIDRLFKEL